MFDDEVNDACACPICGERDIDSLAWINDEHVQCATCSAIYTPGEDNVMTGPFSRN